MVDANIIDLPKIKEFVFKEDSDNKVRRGVIAQELEKFAPEMVTTDKAGYKSVMYTDFLLAKNVALEARIAKLEELIKSLL